MEENHNTIIKQTVRAVLKPKGMFQKGSSRTLADSETAKTIPLVNSGIAPFWSAWNQFMTAALAGDIPLCLELESKVRRTLDNIPIDGAEKMLMQILFLLEEPQKLYAYIVDKIAVQRAYRRSKPGLKRLSVHPEFG